MRVNEPVTQSEFLFPSGATLMSTTDTRGHITYANEAFIAVSGFSREEIEGRPHNLVRHPDMPREAFADMWATLKGGEPWTALVKNRRKNGDHYWVRANAIPVVRDGQAQGYMSVRTQPGREEVAAAEALYAGLREGRADCRLHKGLVLRKGLRGWRSVLQTLSVRWRIRGALGALLPVVTLAAWGAGLAGGALAGFAAVLAAGLLLAGWGLEAQIARPLEQLREQAIKVVTGENRMAAPMERVDEIGMTLRCIGQLGLMFRWLIDDVSQQVGAVRQAAAEIAQGNADLSNRTEQAAGSVQETASSMEQMAVTVRHGADTAAQAERLSGLARDAAARGGQAMAEVVATMGDIASSSHQIADIVGLIDSIAFQTNILALNAAVEAARAGEQGRGFAVVAGEVRALAQRSAAAARDIKGLIGNSAQMVDAGTTLVAEAGQAMAGIEAQVRQVSSLIGELSAATAQLHGGISGINLAVSHLDQVTQQNAALVEQSAGASDSLSRQTARLEQAVAAFSAAAVPAEAGTAVAPVVNARRPATERVPHQGLSPLAALGVV
ncbi:methyl-accepting chemotaxis protein [Azohydromonas caseinilytica]|uniref:PAS domain-containing protein n=1 Tax=Azohydromonas caseinilytica TaxID=2728836 RepID=A0A848FKC6_9BURK|nr:PAS domain-containing methyl-accepting chemotaxis protein [Azohydromonas caseinilytica]NML18779.1 PAS domain-containing protein [Azohydromonas caseinilytica]